jgi:hypothetical protein
MQPDAPSSAKVEAAQAKVEAALDKRFGFAAL